MGMRKLALSLAPFALVAAVGCAASSAPDGNADARSPALTAPGAPALASPDATKRAPHVGARGGAFPPRVSVPKGAKRAEVCAHDDGDMKKAFREYVASQGGTVVRPSRDVTKWKWNGSAYECRFCDLDGMELYVSVSDRNLEIVDSSMAGTLIDSTGVSVELDNVYARGARFADYVSVAAYNADLRCTDFDLDAPSETPITQGQGVDFSGARGTLYMKGAYLHDPRFTGAEAKIVLDGATLLDPRLDGLGGEISLGGGYLGGEIALDGSDVTIAATNMTFTSPVFRFGGARGVLRLAGKNVFEGGDLTAPHEGFRVELAGGATRVTKGTRWPVGEGRILSSDAELTKVDFSGAPGASLVTAEGEVFPRAPLDLSGLRLSRGALPQGTDLRSLTLEGAALEGVDLSRFPMAGTPGHPTRLAHANLQLADLGGRSIEAVDFSHADLRGANLTGASGNADFSFATAGVLPAHVGANTTDAPAFTSFARAVLGTSRFDHAQLQEARFTQASAADVTFDGATLDGARFDGAHLRRAGRGPDVANQTLSKAVSARGASFDGADLRGADLSRLDLGPLGDARASFVGAYLCGAKLTGARLRGADLSGAFVDVVGNVTAPDTGEVIACAPADREGADTQRASPTVVTRCPAGGHAPEGADGRCADAQWRVEGVASCTAEQTANAVDEGGACRVDCDCMSLRCGASGTCLAPDGAR